MSVQDMCIPVKDTQGICLLSLDGGGPGSISQLRMMEEIMSRIAFELDKEKDELRPADYFDLMGGVGFGGLCALFLGRLRMTVDQTMEELSALATAIFPKVSSEISSPEANMDRMREFIESILKRFSYPTNLKLRDTSGSRCKVVVFAATKTHMNHCHAFRTYQSPHSGIDSTFVEAACAILAVPDIFTPVSIGRISIKQLFAGIPYGFNNPTKEVLKEARLVFGDEMHVSLVLSLGSGQQPLLPNADSHKTLLARIVNDCDPVTQDLSHQFSGAGEYLRLNVDRGLESISISDWDDLGSILSSTDWLLKRAGTVTLGQLIGSRKSNLRVHSQELTQHLAMEVKQMSNIMQQVIEKITLVDAVGNRIPVPLQLCRTYSMFAGIIKLYFEDHRPPGGSLVKRGHYQLVSGAQRSIIGSSSWELALSPGMMVEMSMVRHDRHDNTSCPRCGIVSIGWTKDEWATCLLCQAKFHITEEPLQDNDLVPTAVLADTKRKTAGIKRGREQVGQEDEEIDEWMKFRLISVIKHLQSSPSIPKSTDKPTPASPAPVKRIKQSREGYFPSIGKALGFSEERHYLSLPTSEIRTEDVETLIEATAAEIQPLPGQTNSPQVDDASIDIYERRQSTSEVKDGGLSEEERVRPITPVPMAIPPHPIDRRWQSPSSTHAHEEENAIDNHPMVDTGDIHQNSPQPSGRWKEGRDVRSLSPVAMAPIVIRGRLVTPPSRESTPAHSSPSLGALRTRSVSTSNASTSDGETEDSPEDDMDEDSDEDSDVQMESETDSGSLTPAPSPPTLSAVGISGAFAFGPSSTDPPASPQHPFNKTLLQNALISSLNTVNAPQVPVEPEEPATSTVPIRRMTLKDYANRKKNEVTSPSNPMTVVTTAPVAGWVSPSAGRGIPLPEAQLVETYTTSDQTMLEPRGPARDNWDRLSDSEVGITATGPRRGDGRKPRGRGRGSGTGGGAGGTPRDNGNASKKKGSIPEIILIPKKSVQGRGRGRGRGRGFVRRSSSSGESNLMSE